MLQFVAHCANSYTLSTHLGGESLHKEANSAQAWNGSDVRPVQKFMAQWCAGGVWFAQ